MGGAIVVWHEGQNKVEKTLAQRLDRDGNLLWGADGVPIDAGGIYSNYKITSDGDSGAIIIRDDYYNISSVHLNSSGEFSPAGDKNQIHRKGLIFDSEILLNGHGGLYIVWAEKYIGVNFLRDDTNLYAQELDKSGISVWQGGPLAICTATGDQNYLNLVADNSGGFIVAWQDFRNNSRYIFAQRVDASGNILWAKNGINLGRYYYPFRDFEMVSNGQGGAILLREEGESLSPKIFLQVVDNKGASTEPETSLYPQGLPRDKKDYEAVIGSTTTLSYSPTERPVWVWLIPPVIIIAAIAIFFIIRKFRRKQKDLRELR
jgi:hypothetical protein